MLKFALNSKKILLISMFVGIVTLLYLSSLFKSYQRLSGAESLLDQAQERKELLEAEKRELLFELDSVKTDEFKEFLAREKLGLIKDGEYVVILPEEDVLRRLSPREIEDNNPKLPDSNWKKWGNVLFGV